MKKRDEIYAKIKQRRWQMLIHSCLYYNMNENIVSDATWSRWAIELRDLQDQYPDISRDVEFAEYFQGWTGSSGFDLPINEDWIYEKANRILYNYYNEHGNKN